MKKEIVQAVLQFLTRVQLQGNEVPAFNHVVNELNKELQGSVSIPDIPSDVSSGEKKTNKK